jgi:hypothetical protein
VFEKDYTLFDAILSQLIITIQHMVYVGLWHITPPLHWTKNMLRRWQEIVK